MPVKIAPFSEADLEEASELLEHRREKSKIEEVFLSPSRYTISSQQTR